MTLEELKIEATRAKWFPIGGKRWIMVTCAQWDEIHRAAKTDDTIEIDGDLVWLDGVEIRLDHAI